MGIERDCAGGPALGQDLHRKKLGVDFRFEGPGLAGHAGRILVRSVRCKTHIPNIGLRHGQITHVADESFAALGDGQIAAVRRAFDAWTIVPDGRNG